MSAGAAGDRFLAVRDARLRIRDDGDGFPLVLIHGWAVDLQMWDPVADRLRARFRIVRFDRRGFGLSSGVPSLAADVSDVLALMSALAIERAAMIGMSQGARVALGVCAIARDRVGALVLDGAPGRSDSEVPLAHYRELIAAFGMEAFRREWLAHPFMRLFNRRPGAVRLLHEMLMRYPGNDLRPPDDGRLTGNTAGARDLTQTDVDIPTLVLNGEHDTARREAADALCARLPHAERAIVSGAGHLSALDAPEEYSEIVSRFIERHCRPDRRSS